MASLTAHLRRPEDHGRLAFHPQCPLCCDERLAGALPPDAVVSRRTQAVLTAGVLALSSAMPTAAIAAEPDQEQEGSATPEQVAREAPASVPGVDPGGNATELPFEAAQAPSAPVAPDATGDAGPVEQEPVTNADAPVADAGDGSGTAAPSVPDAEPTPAAPAPSAPTTAPETPRTSTRADAAPDPPDPGIPSIPPTTEAPNVETPTESRPVSGARTHEHRRDATPKPAPAPAPAPVLAPLPQATGETPAAQGTPVTEQVTQRSPRTDAATTASRPAGRGDRLHVVEPGESLWSIARDRLGDGASAARIAREVNRLWELNSERIRSGDRDLVVVGTTLALR